MLYNRLDKRSRIWLFAGLQSLRALSFVAVVSVTLVGAVALLAHILARWVPYCAYRVTGAGTTTKTSEPARLLFFILICRRSSRPRSDLEPFWTPSQARCCCSGSPSRRAASCCGARAARTSRPGGH